ncbi:MgtC/SapB family protein [Rodentibacter haemolyticus]|uniref:Protein MgtC n=1 Tax=Rodentibacter haemolyticus TaxID=2778911 RepID=A0ABX6UV04_9PAST|nr:MgtC/SapB family protein [Rodentibacter haemolyticus]QPB41668.1 MgtC/SapB family protein [Rodentibacter haemolyticus]
MENPPLILTALFASLHLTILGKMFLALILGSIIGLERELKHKPVGIKTCAIIAITTCTLTIVSIQAAEHYAQVSENIRTDPMRLAAQVISGIGFLGAGVILHKKNDAISGLTTAAIIWAAAGIGIATGAGFIFDAFIATAMILIAIRFSPMVQRLIRRKGRKKKTKISIHLRSSGAIAIITNLLIQNDYRIENLAVKDLANGEVRVQIRCFAIDNTIIKDVYTLLKTEEDVLSVELFEN